jgi:cyclopropane fatty-acyl-phospholipid synthase-like methyltransferase/methyltransferase-like protein
VSDPLLASYEAVPYHSRAIALADVSAIEVIALLHGLRSPSSDACRVLELGCASGGHLLSMAYQLPGSQFVGVDLAPSQIAEGRDMVAALGMTNVSLEAKNIADIDDEFGIFDYIVCHGVYSWVPAEVQDAILRICSRNLAPNGVAYVSYNTYPGWHARGMLRDMILFHDDPSLAPADRIARARTFVGAVVASQPNPSSPYAITLAEQHQYLAEQEESSFLHEQLESFNAPVYFTAFAERAAAHGLGYLADAKLSSSTRGVPSAMRRAGVDTADVVRAQQYSDFATGRTFRRSLLCHDANETSALPASDALVELHLAMRAAPVAPSAEDAARGGDVQSFRSPDGATITTNSPLVLAALRSLLRVAPATLAFSEVLRRVDARLDADATPGLEQGKTDRTRDLAGAMLQCATAGLISLHPRASTFTTRVSERPVASAIARFAARRDSVISNLRHNLVELAPLERFVLMHLDGLHSRADLLVVVEQALADGAFGSAELSVGVTDLAATIEATLARFATVALLEQ